MHGTIFVELRKYVEAKLGTEAWPKLLAAAGFDGRSYEALEEYPDADAVKLVTTASSITGLEAGAILEDFGVFIAPDLLEMYWALIQPGWGERGGATCSSGEAAPIGPPHLSPGRGSTFVRRAHSSQRPASSRTLSG